MEYIIQVGTYIIIFVCLFAKLHRRTDGQTDRHLRDYTAYTALA